ncbi:MAG: ATPase [Desulfobulbaceae bacterium]|nr:MAG: ATPase [Desulfobulbaceae bacterium]
MPDTRWETLEVPETFDLLASSEAGLASAEAAKRLAEIGPNVLAAEEKINIFSIIIHQFKSPLIYVLLVAAVVTFFLHEYIDMAVILAVVILNAIIGFIQEVKAEQGVRSLKKMVQAKARALRDRREKEIPGSQLVPGDVVYLAAGMRVPADLRLIHELDLRIDESMLTGESLPSDKKTEKLIEQNLTPGDMKNIAFMGTTVVYGRGRGVVVETGRRTVIGDIAEKVQEVPFGKAPLQQKLDSFAKFLSWTVGGISLLIFGLGLYEGEKLSDMFIAAVAIAVSAIPEGLPVAVTVALAIGVNRMARQNAIVRRLPSVETLGSTTVIGSDKTGTLTRNEMTVKLVFDGLRTYEISGIGYEPEGSISHESQLVDMTTCMELEQTLRIGMLCNESNLYQEDGEYRIDGDPTEGALIVSAIKGGLQVEEEQMRYPQLGLVPFESERGFMATLHEIEGRKIIFAKGAPEKIIHFSMLDEADPGPGNRLAQVAANLADQGLRVLGLAYKEVDAETTRICQADVESGLIFAGLQAMLDPPRQEVVEAIRMCKQAGIRTAMITGDHAITAGAVAGQIGIATEKDQVLEGRHIETMSDDELYEKAKITSVYARVAPAHKLRIVQQLIKQGEVVAVTGDGVNDAPALKAAHIGVAMGRTGTDVAKEAADIVLSDDNFASIVAAVREGRIVYDNIKKVTIFLVSCGLGELLTIIACMLAGLHLPYLPAQILWLNLVTNGFQDVALAFEPGEKDVLSRKPRPSRERILSALMIQRTLLMGSILGFGTFIVYYLELASGVPVDSARSVALTTMVFFQFYQAMNCRSETLSIFEMHPLSNPFLFVSMIGAFYAHLAVLYVPALQYVFRTVPLDFGQWVIVIVSSVTVVIGVELDKFMRRRKALP